MLNFVLHYYITNLLLQAKSIFVSFSFFSNFHPSERGGQLSYLRFAVAVRLVPFLP